MLENWISKFWTKTGKFKGKNRIIWMFHRKFINKALNIRLKLKDNINITLPNLKESIAFNLFFNGSYEEDLVNFIIKELPKNGTFIDVGGNIGAISIFVALKRKDVNIVSFEASPKVFHYLDKNIKENYLINVKSVNLAIYNENNKHLNFFSPDEKFGKGSLKSVFTDSAEVVETIRLDQYFKDNNLIPSIIKVDVEGFEKVVFESLDEYIKTYSKRPIIIFEFVDWAEELSGLGKAGSAQKYLLDAGYKLYDFENFVKGKLEAIITPITFGSREIIAI